VTGACSDDLSRSTATAIATATLSNLIALQRSCTTIIFREQCIDCQVIMSRIRLVLFDAFDTLITPRLPIHVQYAQEAHRHGLSESIITPATVRSAFKPAFRKTNERFPEWGRHAQPKMSPSEWWMVCIEETMRMAGAEQGQLEEVMPRLGKALLDRFESAKGYRAFDDVIPCCEFAKTHVVR
jgi:FMN phosphatase YigB (HAD superfamily)